MGKMEELRRHGANMAESMGAGRQPGVPPGIDLGSATRMPTNLEGVRRDHQAVLIQLDRIDRDPDQPREEFDEEALGRLAESLRTRGQLQPVRVRWDQAAEKYIILVGERRWRAARLAGLTELACILVEGELPAEERLMLQLVENCLREDLRPVEQARAFRALMNARGWSGHQLAKELQIGQASVVRALSLLELPTDVQDRVEQGALAASVAHELSKLPDTEQQRQLAEVTIAEDLTRDEVAEAVKAVKARRSPATSRSAPVELEVEPGVMVTIRWRRANSLTATQALRRALKMLQGQEKSDPQAA
jgi:ParB family chromosome partitioning protein